MGTEWQITIWDTIPDTSLHDMHAELLSMSQEFDATYSRFIDTSLVWQLTKQTGVVAVPNACVEMLSWYKKLFEATEKKFTPLIGFSLSDLGYDAHYSLTQKETVRSVPDFNDTIIIEDKNHIRISKPVLLDFGGLGKGYFVDTIATFLKNKNVRRFLVDGSGDVAYSGEGVPIRVGLEHPDDARKVIGAIEIQHGSICSSGSNRRKWGNYHHIINPHTLTSPMDILATWVLADSTVLADALATCLFFTSPEKLQAFPFEYCILNNEYKVKRSTGFTAELFYEA
jgi:FAD:protein FMN transferase